MALRSFREGDRVKAIVLSVDEEKRRISLSLKPSYFSEDDFTVEDEAGDLDENAPLGVVEDASDDASEGEPDEEDDEQPLGEDVDAEENDSEEEADETMQVDLDVDTSTVVTRTVKGNLLSAPRLDLGSGFQWSVQPSHDDEISASSSDEEDEDAQAHKKKKRRRKGIEQDLTADLHTKVPESNADFERVLLGSPNSSYLWVQYMSFQLQLSEVEKARAIAQRALRTISFREEQEKLNVWIALLNIENVYGTEQSLETTFKDAARHNDSKTIHLRLAAILEQSDKIEVLVYSCIYES